MAELTLSGSRVPGYINETEMLNGCTFSVADPGLSSLRGSQSIISQLFVSRINCMQIEEIGPRGGVRP